MILCVDCNLKVIFNLLRLMSSFVMSGDERSKFVQNLNLWEIK